MPTTRMTLLCAANLLTIGGLASKCAGESNPPAAPGATVAGALGVPCGPWHKTADPVWDGFLLAADPSVIHTETGYRMYHTAFLPEPPRALIAVADSPDGLSWDWATPTDPENPVSIALDGQPGAWDEQLETAHVMRVGDEYWMFYSGYVVDKSQIVSPYEIGLAKSPDGLTWTRASDAPVLPLAPSGPDNLAMTSPSVVRWGGVFYMVYLGWEADSAGELVGLRINGATSVDPLGLVWSRHPAAVLEFPRDDLPAIDGAVEPMLLQTSEERFLLFITADNGDSPISPSSIAVLESDHPFGPWSACGGMAVRMSEPWESVEVIAPTALEEPNGSFRVWYHGLTFDDPATGERFRVGHARSQAPSPDQTTQPNDITPQRGPVRVVPRPLRSILPSP